MTNAQELGKVLRYYWANPAAPELSELGKRWVESSKRLGLRVAGVERLMLADLGRCDSRLVSGWLGDQGRKVFSA